MQLMTRGERSAARPDAWAQAFSSEEAPALAKPDFSRFVRYGEALRVLVVDDDEALRLVIAESLSDEGVHAETCAEGRAALEILQRSRFDLVILDLKMPGMDGWEFRALQRKHPALSTIPVLAITGDRSERARAVEADGLLHKPFGTNVLLASVGRVLEESERRRLAHRLVEAERLAVLGRLAGSLGQELNKPLTGVAFNVRAILERVTRADPAALAAVLGIVETPQMLREAVEAVERLETVVGELGRLVKKPDEAFARVDVEVLLDQALELLRPELQHRAAVTRHYSGVPPITVQAGKLSELFVNLLLNAASALPESRSLGQVTLATNTEQNHILVEVTDTGAGLAPDFLPYVFEPFFSVPGATGLRLAACREIAVAHGGAVQVESVLGEGTTVRVRLPRNPPSEPPGFRSDTRLRLPATQQSSPKRVLVIDDDPLVLRTVFRILSAEYEVSAADSLTEGLRLIHSQGEFDAVLCDLSMPDGGGRELYERWSRAAPDSLRRVVFITGGIEADFAAIVQSERLTLLNKPFDLAELLRTVRDIVTERDR